MVSLQRDDSWVCKVVMTTTDAGDSSADLGFSPYDRLEYVHIREPALP